VIEGRSDSTLNRGGVRMGSAEIYAAVESLPAIADSLVVGVELPEGAYYMALFVVPAGDGELDDGLRAEITDVIRSGLSPRHVPDDIVRVPAIPRTLTGKKLEVPVKRLLQGRPLDDVVDLKTVNDKEAMRWFAWFAEQRQAPAVGAETQT
jgi:acetoacetyl-CoA synthetase